MELIRTNENVNKVYDSQGNVTENVTSVQFAIHENSEKIGDANVYQGGFSININKQGAIDIFIAQLQAILTKGGSE